MLKICVVGVGAVGGLIGSRLSQAGQRVSALARGDTLATLHANGLGLEVDGELHHYPVEATADAASLGQQDLIVVAVKEPALRSAAEAIQPLMGPQTRVLLAMNGVPWWFFDGRGGPLEGSTLTSVDPDGRLRDLIPTEQVIGCVAHLSATNPAPGISHHRFGNTLIIGQPDGDISPQTQAAADVLNQAGFDAPIDASIQQQIWFKLWGNMTMNPVSALTRATTDRIIGDPLVNEFCMRAMREAAAVGEAIGLPIAQSPEERNAVTLQLGAMKTSMLQDVEASKSLEVEALIGVVHEIAQRVGVETPTIAAIYGMTRLLANR